MEAPLSTHRPRSPVTHRRQQPNRESPQHIAHWHVTAERSYVVAETNGIAVLHMQTPSPYTEFGMKGIGEGGAVGPPAAIVSAVNDALWRVGAQVHDLPLTPARVLAAIESASCR